MFVSLKVPDNVAITAFNTLKRMGYKELKQLERSDYYKFEIANNIESFKKQISNTDILVNSNKNKFSFSLGETKDKKDNMANVLVQDLDNCSGLISVLRERLGFKNIKSMEKGVLWTMHFDKKANAKKIAVGIAKNLLMNENYQRFRVIEQDERRG